MKQHCGLNIETKLAEAVVKWESFKRPPVHKGNSTLTGVQKGTTASKSRNDENVMSVEGCW